MNLWIDAQLSPHLAPWIAESFQVEAKAVRDVGLLDATDSEIYFAARDAGVIVVTKDRDFVYLLDQHGPPPKVLWITCGNTSNAYLKGILERTLMRSLDILESSESLVEIGDK